MAEAARQGDKLNVFISYSRDDLDVRGPARCGSGARGLRHEHRPARHFGRRGVGDAPRRSHPRRRHGRFRALAVVGSLRDVRLGGRGSGSARQAYPSGALSPARGREPAAAACRPQLHLLLRGAEISGLGIRLWAGASWRRRSIPISTGCASTRAICSGRPSGMRAAGPRTGFFPAPTSRRQRRGRRAGPRTRRSRPNCSSISSRRARPRTIRQQSAEAQRLKADRRRARRKRAGAGARSRGAQERGGGAKARGRTGAARCAADDGGTSGRSSFLALAAGSFAIYAINRARSGPSPDVARIESDPNSRPNSAISPRRLQRRPTNSATGPYCRSRARSRSSRRRRARRAISRRRCCWRWRRCRSRGLAALVRGLPKRRPPCIRRGCGTGRRRWPGTWSPSVSASFSPDGTHVVTASDDKTARVWDLRGERPTFVALEGHQGRGHLRVVQPRRDACGHGV